nr:hypothetical protein [Frankia sp. Cppng1_Ct_nod]
MTTITQPLSLLDVAPVVPVVVLNDLQTAVPLARALVTGGLPIIEVTLRTEMALQSIKKIAAEVSESLVGAGTVITVDQAKQAVDAGARFLVSPGCTDRLLDAMDASGLPYLPGVATVSEMLGVLDRGRADRNLARAAASLSTPDATVRL